MWLKVNNPNLRSFKYERLGMDEKKEVTDNGKVQVSEEVGEELVDHFNGDFEIIDDDGGEQIDFET